MLKTTPSFTPSQAPAAMVKQVNDQALTEGMRILSAYQAANGTKFWIITEADCSVTTVLQPEDY